MSQPLGVPAWMALLSSSDLMGSTSPTSAAMPAEGTSDRFEALMREVFVGGGLPGVSSPLAAPEAPMPDRELDPMSPEAWEIPGDVMPPTTSVSTALPAAPPLSAGPAGTLAEEASDALPSPAPGDAPVSRPIRLAGPSLAPAGGMDVGSPRFSVPPPHALESPRFDPGTPGPMVPRDAALPSSPAEPSSQPTSVSSLGPRPVAQAPDGPGGQPGMVRPASMPLGDLVPVRPAGVAPFPAASVTSTFPGPALSGPEPAQPQGASRRGSSVSARPAGSSGSHSAPLPFVGADTDTGATPMSVAPSPMDLPASGQVDPEVVMNVDEQAVMRPSDGPTREDGPAAGEALSESQGFRIVSHAGPEGLYGSHRSAHHTSPASIPPPSQSYEAAPEPDSPVLDLSALHRDAVAALSEEGAEVRVRVDDDVAVDVRVEGEAVHVVLETPESVARDFDGMQQDLADQLAQSGSELGSYAHRFRDEGSDTERSSSNRAGGEGEMAEVEASTQAPVARGRLVNRIA